MKLEDDRKRCVTIESRKHEHPLGSGTRQGWKPFRNPSPIPREMGGTTRRSSVQPFPNKTPHHTIDSIIRIAEIRGRSGGALRSPQTVETYGISWPVCRVVRIRMRD